MKKLWKQLSEWRRILRGRCKQCGGEIKGGFQRFEYAPKHTCYTCWFESELNPIREGWFRVARTVPWEEFMRTDK